MCLRVPGFHGSADVLSAGNLIQNQSFSGRSLKWHLRTLKRLISDNSLLTPIFQAVQDNRRNPTDALKRIKTLVEKAGGKNSHGYIRQHYELSFSSLNCT